tara:strand:+ start:674 stop:1561 length:888 start_codon:yes stop_codon:yes gene_type:complete
MEIQIIGAETPSAQAFINIVNSEKSNYNTKILSRRMDGVNYLELNKPELYTPNNESEFILVSFAPIWTLSEFLNSIFKNQPKKLNGLVGLIVCSSSSVITKRNSGSKYDRELVNKLIKSEKKIISIFKILKKSVYIIRPSMIYGNINNFRDNNINKLKELMRKFPFIFIPHTMGMRQPIHATQLAEIFYFFTKKIDKNHISSSEIIKLTVGGDVIISYNELLLRIKKHLPPEDPGKICYLIKIPNSLFFFFAFFVNLISPKTGEILYRLRADLSGFTPSFKIINQTPIDFPMSDK